MTAAARRPRTAWFATEVVQTSAMDCGPAALKCLLDGFGVKVSYGRLREACQTDIDGTSIDVIEGVANTLGVEAEQVLVPRDHALLDSAGALPAIAVVKQPGGGTHFVVVWRRFRSLVQVMDPALGRRWLPGAAFAGQLFEHEQSVPAAAWREWAGSSDFLDPLRERLGRIGATGAEAKALVGAALAEPMWYPVAVLDAAVRLVGSLAGAGGVRPGPEATALVRALFERTLASPDDIYTLIPRSVWSVAPDPRSAEYGERRLLARGAVLVRAHARRGHAEAARKPMSRELRAALAEGAPRGLRAMWGLLRLDGLLSPAMILAAMGIATVAALLEVTLFRGALELGSALPSDGARLAGIAALVLFSAVLFAVRVPIAGESFRLGRHFETRLRLALLRKLPRLSDRYFASRPVSDLADRAHGIHVLRNLPGLGLHFLQTIFEIAILLGGVALIDGTTAAIAAVGVLVATGLALAAHPLLRETDMRARTQAGALSGFYLDALQGAIPIRVHHAEASVRQMHEALLVEWLRSSRRLLRVSLLSRFVQQTIATVIAAALLIQHFAAAGGVGPADLLLVYWVLKLPTLAQTLGGLVVRYPEMRNVFLRLAEPLMAPTAPGTGQAPVAAPTVRRRHGGIAVDISGGRVVAAGRTLLDGVHLRIAAGEHVAIVGRSGAGKSTLLGLLLGWHRLAAGRLSLDGAAAAPEDVVALRRRVAWVDPTVRLWNAPLGDNLAYAAGGADADAIAMAVDVAELGGVVERLPEGMATALGEGGGLLSGGEGQRARLARALAQPGVALALLDEPFRGLDHDQRHRLLVGARRHWADATLLCVTHDIGETLGFDRVLVIEDGAIVADGRPAELALRPGRYRALLDAEREALRSSYGGPGWRRLRMEGGRVVEHR